MWITKWLLKLNFKIKGLNAFKRYDELLDNEKLNSEELIILQNKKIEEFVKYCYDNVPYYKELFDDNQINPADIKTKFDLKKIPLLTKEIIRNNSEKLISNKFKIDELTKTNTSGSTGKPVSLYSGDNRKINLIAGLWRIYSRSGWKPGENIAYLWGFKGGENVNKKFSQTLKERIAGATYLSAWKSNDDDFKNWYKEIKKNKSTIIVCYASTGSRFAKWLIDNDLKLSKIKGIYCTSEKLYEYQKVLIRKAFDCNVYNLYGCGEVNHIACTCNEGSMHINPDMVVVELGDINDNGDTPFVLTGFTNRAMPFLRYVNGDAGSLIDKTCSCGLKTPLMDLSVSRLSDIFTFNDGKKYPSLYFILQLYCDGLEGIELFQFHQDKIDHIFLYIVKNNMFNENTELKMLNIVKEIEKHINNKATVTIEYKDYIAQSISSKHYYAKSDVKDV
ncbi:phenylacetate--CoA ligase family protein [Tenacibaculum finnmarkense]|uniref:phenylacetate--CoA ligase family protein n=1 Tax=Tenacibaculum finnmarkense TaxID=2781243 RepID=UPI001E3A589D|nr:hypothetical protein [Tenacibaculum finnmarkense]MCD8411715.1 hypothetical protein [Tenacibaculum finnmarkense genomovar ulcerans]MCD8454722.1 hypothetical protein [Tenacibaculum finnmarkense genomovar ulcerans]MCG8206773.1 phenylacetate--CoA ligase family protein [Tenacibaculum finnmarkense genomovar finnmarkense]MCG8209880.1 phenylacetate--CoA ligase family protein [Tenacibaculum finnmarkense genomovar finnmarkense]MCG8225455.1 phenylacetate--CoA ligase family protein [Tenacibaculum finnm